VVQLKLQSAAPLVTVEPIMEAVQDLPTFENEQNRIIDLLDRHLASAIDLQLRIRHALWNAEDPRLAETRELNATASEFQQFCDLIALRLRTLGAVAEATLQRTRARSFLDPDPHVAASDEEQISAIDRALAKFRYSARQARENAAAFRDQTTAALFGKLANSIDAQIWFLRSPSR
jgi:DNA-binding ferritin-like protein